MNVQAVLTTLKNAGTRVLLKDGKLKVQTKNGPLQPEIKALISQHKSALMAFLQQAENAKAAKTRQAVMTIPKAPATDKIPLSHAQQRLWLLDKLGAEGATYLINMALMLDGPLDVAALQQSFEILYRRHDVLRAVFVERQAEVYQTIVDEQPLCFRQHRVTEGELKTRLAEIAVADMPLTEGPLFEVHLFAVNDTRHGLLIRLHHIIADGWSMGVLVQELTECYGTLSGGKTPQLPPLDIQYADYAIWQRAEVSEAQLEKQQAFWLDLLKDAPQLLTLPYDRPRPPVQTFNGKVYRKPVYPEVYRALNQLAQSRSTTIYVPLLVCYAVMLAKFSGMSDIVVGAPFAGRSNKQLESLIGFFVSTGALRLQVTPDTRLSTLLETLKAQFIQAQTNQDVAFEQIVEKLLPKRDFSYSPLFQVMFDLEKAMVSASGGDEHGDGLNITPMDSNVEVAKFDLTLNFNESNNGLVAFFEYNTDLFDHSTITTMSEAYIAIAQAMVQNPDIRVDQLVLGQAEQAMCGPVVNHEQDLTAVFEKVVAERAQAIAIEGREGQWTYETLNRRVDQIAWQMHELGVKPGDRVAIFLERSFDMMASALAALKLGAVYLPIDAGYPSERVNHMLYDAQPKVLLSHSGLARPDAVEQGLDTICIEVDKLGLNDQVQTLPTGAFSPLAGAYLMYTSGSTGKPKGVLINRRAVLNHALHMARTFRVGPDDRALQFSSFSFDIAVEELYSTLLCGATLVLYQDDLGLGLAEFEQYVFDKQISIVNLPTAYWHLWANHAAQHCASASAVPFAQPHVRLVIVGGEAARFDCLQSWQQCYPHIRWLNTYGPTETTVTASIWDNEGQDIDALAQPQIPLGLPLSNGRLYVLDEALNPVPPGVTGKLYIAGLALANGYWQQPGKTVEVFLPDPFAKTPGERMYDTGDLVRINHLGDLEYKGRADYQVKIRGFRIEPDEVANVLKGCEGVSDAVVLAVSLGEVGKQLVGYAACDEGIGAENLKVQLGKLLPDYMVPSQIVVMSELPLTANGKIDRKALPEPNQEAAEVTLPEGETEQILHDHWTELLGREQISTSDNFFELGGHSLLAVQLVSRIREAFSIDFQIKTLFEAPTIRTLAQAIQSNQNQTEAYRLTQLPEGIVPVLSYAQQRLWFLDRLAGESNAYNMPMAMRLTGDINYQVLESCFKSLVERHESLRTTFTEIDGQATVVVANVEDWHIQYETLASCDVPERVDAFSSEIFNLSEGPLFKVLVITESAHSAVLAMNLHHIIGDGWSFGILGRELSNLYHAGVTGGSAGLEPLPVQYSDYAYWQRQWLEGGELQRQLQYWQEKMADAPSLLDLPTDRLRPAVQSFAGALYQFDLPCELAQQVKSLAQQKGCTAYMVWLAGFKILLALYSGQRDIVVGSPTANRGRTEIEGIIGFFVNTLVLRDKLDLSNSFSQFLNSVKTTFLDAQAHQDVPFEQLVEVLQPDRSLSYSPLFQVCFDVFSGNAAGQEGLELPGLEANAISEGEHRIAKFDLVLNVQQHEEGASAGIEYCTDLFELSTIKQMMADFQAVMTAVTGQCDVRLDSLAIVDKKVTTSAQLCGEQRSCEGDIIERFEAIAASNPDKTAVELAQKSWSYGELNSRANQLATVLLDRGIKPGDTVSIYLDRCFDRVAGLLAILKCGAMFLPIDANFSKSRVEYMLDDAEAKVILSRGDIYQHPERHVVDLSEIESAVDVANVDCRVAGLMPAYVMYTSGSTGKPKGAINRRSSLLNYARHMAEMFNLDSDAKVLQFGSLSFDIMIQDIFPTLLVGATIVLYDDEQGLGLDKFEQYLEQRQVTLANPPAAYMHLWIDHLPLSTQPLKALKAVYTGGEAADFDKWRRWLDAKPQVLTVNAYGPTEATVASCAWVCQKASFEQLLDKRVPIGKCIQNGHLYPR